MPNFPSRQDKTKMDAPKTPLQRGHTLSHIGQPNSLNDQDVTDQERKKEIFAFLQECIRALHEKNYCLIRERNMQCAGSAIEAVQCLRSSPIDGGFNEMSDIQKKLARYTISSDARQTALSLSSLSELMKTQLQRVVHQLQITCGRASVTIEDKGALEKESSREVWCKTEDSQRPASALKSRLKSNGNDSLSFFEARNSNLSLKSNVFEVNLLSMLSQAFLKIIDQVNFLSQHVSLLVNII